MRLVVQAQTVEVQQLVHDAWLSLPPADKRTLSDEMSLTGLADEGYAPVKEWIGGPAFLVYYSPSFVKVKSSIAAA